MQIPSYDQIELDRVDSTNRFLKDHIKTHLVSRPLICTTRQQTSGYGQRQRVWLTTDRSCIFSIAYPLSEGLKPDPCLSLKVATALHQALHQLTAQALWLKWPNDLFDQRGKVAGILIEVAKTQLNKPCLIIGIGINRQPLTPEQIAVGASAVAFFDHQVLLNQLMTRLESLDFTKQDWVYWTQHDYFLKGEPLNLLSTLDSSVQQAVYQGISYQGAALVKTLESDLALVSSQWSLRKG
ncbi:biotin--[acetyl-CoA-carboxylase] ligase [Thiomicrospira sp. R3]|uniref:biotin--[acetyl-CoA-carboxylase] ligase n=1 Tax=Thiomicrospira sp. R3 TaxID=3035472 RepID=UPI00259BA983|nr:biotin--[acetyl-CoA-carboxylase] ligase [Thiomicrospira sp. R3]WFE69609.1 biotin--[acetyl-CoA-carboxylase] ligase [Thiomicrospira sp. R3]